MISLNLRTHWRSLWRNRRRTLITLAAVAINVMLLIMMIGWMEGVYALMIRNSTEMTLGEAQVHAPEYLKNRHLHRVVENHQDILDAAQAAGIGAAPRLFGFGLVAVGHKSNGAMIWGVEPAAERENFLLPAKIRAGGRWLADAPVDRSGGALAEIVIGSRLAESLQAKVGDHVVALISAADGSSFDTEFVLVGICKTVGGTIDANGVFIHRSDFRRIFFPPNPTAWYAQPDNGQVSGGEGEGDGEGEGNDDPIDPFDMMEEYESGNGAGNETPEQPQIDPATWVPPDVVHEIALIQKTAPGQVAQPPETIVAAVKPAAGDTNVVQTWLELNKPIADMLAASKSTQWILFFIFYLIAGLSVMNTMLMATYERMREFGVMKAIGTSPWRLIGDVATEALLLGLVASVVGAILGAIVTSTLGTTGIDFSGALDEGASFSGIALDPIWYPVFKPFSVVAPMIGMTIICWLAALYPASIAARVDPAKILHEQ